MQHLINLTDLGASDIHALFDRAEALAQQEQPEPSLRGRHIANLFFEPSTRTRVSFELAARSLGGSVVNLNVANSSFTKGETLLDTYKTLRAMGIDAFVVRTGQTGVIQDLGRAMGRDVAVFNAGEGDAAHPTQGLLDALTIRQHKGDFENLSVAIVGDVSHSRVARSSLRALSILGCQDLRIVAPTAWQPPSLQMPQVLITDSLDQGIQGCDVVMTLRIQNERLRSSEQIDRADYIRRFCLTSKRLESARDNAIVMHPGPINRGIEIADEVADGPQSVILKQVSNGVAIRRALFDTVARSRGWYSA